MSLDPNTLPHDLPVPADDGAADHLIDARVPTAALPSTDGREVRLDRGTAPRTVVYAFPRMGRPGEQPLVSGWDAIPGARGCTPETCAFRDRHARLRELGVEVYGLSTQDTAYQRERAGAKLLGPAQGARRGLADDLRGGRAAELHGRRVDHPP